MVRISRKLSSFRVQVRACTVFVLVLFAQVAFSMSGNDSLLQELSHTIERRDAYIQQKQNRIERLHAGLAVGKLPLVSKFNLYNRLYHEYQSFKYDSAFAYALKLHNTAQQLNDSTRMDYAKLKLSFTLLSSGMFKETFDSLNTVDLVHDPDSIKAAYYALKSRAYYDLAAYNSDAYYAESYTRMGNALSDSALALIGRHTLQYHYLSGIRNLNEGKFEKAKSNFQLILDKYNPTYHEYATTASSLAYVYRVEGDIDQAINLMIRAAIADTKSSTKEAVALIYLAELLHNHGDEARAYSFIKQAFEDANFYGARQRKISVSSILPIIEGERLATVESQRSRLLIYAIVVSGLSVLVVAFAYIILRQLKQLKQVKKIVTEANSSLQEANEKLVRMNSKLQETNEALLEANAIKEEYIGHSFNMYSEYLEKIEKLKVAVDKRLKTKSYKEIGQVMDSVSMKEEREALYEGFDKVFLKLFPNFVAAFNSYFKPEDRFVMKDDQSLNVELRIFALIRMGVNDHEQIAKILEYSVRTIYNYKTKVKNKSIVSNEEFERKVMEIRAF